MTLYEVFTCICTIFFIHCILHHVLLYSIIKFRFRSLWLKNSDLNTHLHVPFSENNFIVQVKNVVDLELKLIR